MNIHHPFPSLYEYTPSLPLYLLKPQTLNPKHFPSNSLARPLHVSSSSYDTTHMYPPPHMTHMYPPPHMTHMYPLLG